MYAANYRGTETVDINQTPYLIPLFLCFKDEIKRCIVFTLFWYVQRNFFMILLPAVDLYAGL